ncbi:hypothetical protein [Actinokineospora globicatena]|uniref:hypothetical protein n=1 Tax=Actinokineospora globicatena TaxID=103729 RepID=UPI002552CC8C|nr:hypothetical protein [Actinokineospora globicatena]
MNDDRVSGPDEVHGYRTWSLSVSAPREVLMFRYRRRALASARALDQAVNSQLACVARLPEDARRRSADHLAELVTLAQAYRAYARGWISYRELENRGRIATARLSHLRSPHPAAAHLTERD